MSLSFAIAFAASLSGAQPVGCAGAGQRALGVAEQEAAVRAGLEAKLRREGDSLRIVGVDGLRERCLPAPVAGTEAPRLELGEIAGRWPRARVAVPLRIVQNGAAIRTVSAVVSLSDLRPVPVYLVDAAAKTEAQALRFQTREVDMTCCGGRLALADASVGDALAGLRLRRAVRAGEPALASDFEPVPDVVAHAPVRIEVVRGAVRIVSDGVALADGRIGERVPVRAALSRDAVSARIVAPGAVSIESSP